MFLPNELKMEIGLCKDLRMLSFWASEEGLTLATSVLETHYGGRISLSTQLMKPIYLVLPLTDAAAQFL